MEFRNYKLASAASTFKGIMNEKHSIYRRIFLLTLIFVYLLPDLSVSSEEIESYLKAYPEQVIAAENNQITMKSGRIFLYDDGIRDKSFQEKLSRADLQDQISQPYPKANEKFTEPEIDFDPGRIRSEEFFREMYGQSEKEVPLVKVKWLSKKARDLIKDRYNKRKTKKPWESFFIPNRITVTTVNGVDKRVREISRKLEALICDRPDEFSFYFETFNGAYKWREIKYSNPPRLSAHSFGIAIDINSRSGYWGDTLNYYRRKTGEMDDKSFVPLNSKAYQEWKSGYNHPQLRNDRLYVIPQEIIQIFSDSGFICGVNWYHYDSFHFEYRPELLGIDASKAWK